MQRIYNATIDESQPNIQPTFHNSRDLTGERFSRLTVKSFAGRGKHKQLIWKCICDCGNECLAYGNGLMRGVKQSCGCLHSDVTAKRSTTHGMTKTPTYKSWRSMIRRCEAPVDIGFKNYGARGISVCQRWRDSFEAFLEDMGERPSKKYEIDRYPNNDGNYEPGNCRWATRTEQARNRRSNTMLTHDGKTMCISEWAESLGWNQGQILNRLYLGWSVDDALTTPIRPRKRLGRNRLIEWNGQSKTIGEWATNRGISVAALRLRISHGWSIDEAMTRPYKQRRTSCD